MTDTIAILVSAKRALVEKGWTKHVLEDDKGCLCTIGAIQYAIHGEAIPNPDYNDEDAYAAYRERRDLSNQVIRTVEQAIPVDRRPIYVDENFNEETQQWYDIEVVGDPDVADFNDDERTTLDDVLALLDAAIAKVSG